MFVFCFPSLEAEQTFDKFKDLFSSAPVLYHPDSKLQFIAEVDAFNTGIGAVLLEEPQGP